MIPPPDPPYSKNIDPALRAYLQKLTASIRSCFPRETYGTGQARINHTSRGVGVEIPRRRQGTSEQDLNFEIARFSIVTVHNGALSCYKVLDYDGSGNVLEEELTVLDRPLELMTQHLSDPNKKTVNYPAIDGFDSPAFDLELEEPYAVGDLIWGLRVTYPATGENNAENVFWVDANVDGRHWAFPKRVVAVCVNNVTQHMLIRGGPVF